MSEKGKKTLVDLETGEEVYALVPMKRKYHVGGFFMAMQDGFMYIAQLGLTQEQMRVLLYVMGKLDFENYIMTPQKDIAEALKMDKSKVSKAMKVIVQHGIIHEGPKVGNSKTYRLDPQFGYKGRAKNIDQTKREIKKLAKEKGLSVIEGGKEE